MEAFRVLPPRAGQPPPPPPPSSSPRVAPRFVQQKESSAFVVLGEVGSGAPPSGRASPFRGRGFRAPPTSKIPIKSAPTSPGPRAPKPTVGKSAPASPSRPAPGKRVVTGKQPPSPRKAITRPPAKPRAHQKTTTKDDQTKTTGKKTADNEKRVAKKQNDSGNRTSDNKKLNGTAELSGKNSNETLVRRVKQLDKNNSVSNDAAEKTNGTNGTGVGGPAPRTGRAALERTAVIMDRVNRLRPDKQMISSTRTIKRNSVRTKNEVKESNGKSERNITEKKTTSEEPRNSKSNLPTPENETHDIDKAITSANKTLPPNTKSPGTDTALVTSDNQTAMAVNEGKQVEVNNSTVVEIKPIEKMEPPLNDKIIRSEPLKTTLNTTGPTISNRIVENPMSNGNKTSASMNLLTASSGNISSTGDNEDSSSTSPSSSQLMLVTGTTRVNVEPVKENLNLLEKTNDNIPNKGEERTINKEIVDGSERKTDEKGVIVGVTEKEESNKKANGNGTIPNGDIPAKAGAMGIPNGGETLQNKIIIHQTDKNGMVKVIGSEPVKSDLKEVIKDSIVTETAVPSEEVLLRKEVQSDLIPSGREVEEAPVTVVGQPDIEVDAQPNHTVTFRYPRGHGSMESGLRPPTEVPQIMNGDGRISPEIHPVSARKNKRRNFKAFCSCCHPVNKSQGCSWRLPWFKRRNGPGPPPPPKVKKKRLSLSSLFSHCKCKRKKEPKPPTESSTESAPKAQQREGGNLCKRIFCFCSKKKGPAHESPPGPKKRSYLRKIFCCCCNGGKSTVRPRPQQSQELLINRRKELSKNRTTSVQSGFSKLEQSLVEHSSMMRAAIPVLPICLAWTCLILNVFLPGTGTMTSGILCLCFGKPRFSVNDTAIARLGAFCVNFVIGIGQIFTIIFCLVGWGWSIWWGVIMLRLARKHRRIKIAEKNASQPPSVNQNHDAERGH